jgi:hypothetical protein
MAGKRNKGNGHTVFASLTTEENKVLTAKIDAGRATALHVNGDHDFFTDLSDVRDDLSEAYRQRWNAENPEYRLD